MTKALFYKVASNGLFMSKTVPTNHPGQPHMVAIAAAVVELEGMHVLDTMQVVVKPDGWTIPAQASDVHGITQADAMARGVPEDAALGQLLELWQPQSDSANTLLRIGFGQAFDMRLVRTALMRFGGATAQEVADEWKMAPAADIKTRCTGIVMPSAKQVKVIDAYSQLVGGSIEHPGWPTDCVLAYVDIARALQARGVTFEADTHEDD